MISERRPAAVAARIEAAARRGRRRFELESVDGGGPLDLERLGAARWAAGRDVELRLVVHGSAASPSLEAGLRTFRARLRRD